MTTTAAPPTWDLTRAEGRNGLRQLTRSLLEEEAGRPLWALDALLAVAGIPQDQRVMLLFDLRALDDAEYGMALGDNPLVERQIETIVAAYDKAAYAPPERLTDAEVHDCHAELTPAMLARAELHPLGDPHRCDMDAALVDNLFTADHGGLFGATANHATAEALRLPQRVPGASLVANPPPDVLREVA